MIDTHCHIDFKDFDHDREEVIVRATEMGVDRMINIGVDIPSSRRAFQLANSYEHIYCSVGVHPHDANTLTDDSLVEMRRMAENEKVVAIGEIGLDYYRDMSPRHIQREAFVRQLDLAAELGLPVVIHVREALEDAMKTVHPYLGRVTGVFHCFPGNIDEACMVIGMGFHISVNGIITFKKARMADVAREADLSSILIETDAPYLAPVPYRGKRNNPAYVKFVCMKLAELRGMTVAEVDKITTRNAEKLFRLVETFG
jgi:TatD DNase family protein